MRKWTSLTCGLFCSGRCGHFFLARQGFDDETPSHWVSEPNPSRLASQPSYPVLRAGPVQRLCARPPHLRRWPTLPPLHRASYVSTRRVRAVCNVGPTRSHARPMWAGSSPPHLRVPTALSG
ncbi:hypothetical protein L226DRAFT_91407 [Lentinus tigrinus ALCF2SS1-7]|uniref:Uncharacterized protein n=1 Tax=Lentinus tigrinus ALCF2SS1-6 TaxID=1328759 RepID=A0A5C2RYT3_9APHY|nr:hypothetical protein L227DRAFT_288824 [Lentinus tigrinus ALCF2SS1-6]RPD73941.1 hypothetical protein L226DRAFT_91407 [Lentinus tigrinus ALCF2SS1-7]